MDWFPNDNDPRHERVNELKDVNETIIDNYFI